MDSRPVFVVITAENCGHCKSFKNGPWPDTKAALESMGTVRVVHIELAAMGDALPPQYPSTLQTYIRGFPTLLLVSGESWNRALQSGGPLDYQVFGTDAIGKRGTYSRDKAGIISWINNAVPRLSQGGGTSKTVTKGVNDNSGCTITVRSARRK